MDKSEKELLVKLLLGNANEKETAGEELEQGEWRIVILQRGWIYVGRYFCNGNSCRLEDAKCVRNWGTTKGLGELAESGPTSSTKLDPCPTVEFHRLGEVCNILCKQSVWKKV